MRGDETAAFDDDYVLFPAAPATRDFEGLRRLVRYQRWLVAIVLAQLALWVGYIALSVLGRGIDSAGALNFPTVLTFILGGAGGVYVFLLCWELRGPFVAVVFGLATVVPCLGLLTIVLVNGYATAELKKHNIPVGLFGADLEHVDNRPSPYDDEDAGW